MNIDSVLFALAIAVSPTGVLAAVLFLTTDRGTRKAGAFALGWVLAVGAVGVLTLVADSHLDVTEGSTTSTASAVLYVVLGLLLLGTGARRWMTERSTDRTSPEEPSWMARLDRMPVFVALAFGLFMPPYVIAVAAANSVIRADGAGPTSGTAVVVLTVIASLGVLVPWIVAMTVPSADRWIATWRTWLLANWTKVLLWLLIVVGAYLVIKGTYELLS